MALDSQAFNKTETEEQAVIDHAYALASCLEAATSFAYVVERCGFSTHVNQEFTKKLQRTLDSLLSAVPNQYREKVLTAMNDAAKQAAEEEAKEQATNGSRENYAVGTESLPESATDLATQEVNSPRQDSPQEQPVDGGAA